MQRTNQNTKKILAAGAKRGKRPVIKFKTNFSVTSYWLTTEWREIFKPQANHKAGIQKLNKSGDFKQKYRETFCVQRKVKLIMHFAPRKVGNTFNTWQRSSQFDGVDNKIFTNSLLDRGASSDLSMA